MSHAAHRTLCALLLTLLSGFCFAQERILDFASDVSIESDGTLLVVESIVVQVEGQQIKRGIFRDFPTRYEDRRGATVVIPFEVLSVQRDSAPEQYKVEPLANGMRVRIGNPHLTLPRGPHEYVISYRTGRQLGFFERDELYWNVTGNGWPFVIERASTRIRLPQAVAADKLSAEAFTGPQGARGRNAKATVGDGEFLFETTQRLAPNEGLTIVAVFPKGIVAAPSEFRQVAWMIGDNAGDLLGIGGLAALLAFLFVMWWRVGRDPRKGPPFPRYEAPANMGAAAIRFIDRMGFDSRCLAAAVLGLGARGYLKVQQKDEAFVVQQTGAPVKWLAGEKPMANALFHTGPQAVLSRQYDPAVAEAKNELHSALKHQYKGAVFRKNGWPLWIAVLAGTVAFGFAAFIGANPLLLVALVGILLLALMMFSRLMPAYTREGRKVQDHIEGLRQYLSVAERDELARMKAPEMTPVEFARMLPYALALDVERTWADRFAAVIGTAAVAAAASSYYDGDTSTFGPGSGDGLASSLGALDSTVSAATTAPGSESGSSDGGGGGGSSGGGGGGGGGGGW
ncbi:MAG: DUF2207 domain-containing protein [Pseudomonadota bacterium]|nr:DUF2207 domain-containing protein [Burkholderiaceae bacterium]MDQ3446606.1 DUF2207 domain-containing protein [Pseudomonadota bacterium]